MCCDPKRRCCDCPDVKPLTPMTAAEFIDKTMQFLDELHDNDLRALKLVVKEAK